MNLPCEENWDKYLELSQWIGELHQYTLGHTSQTFGENIIFFHPTDPIFHGFWAFFVAWAKVWIH